MDLSINLLWVILIVILGLALSIYSVCKGWGAIPERGVAGRPFTAPYANLWQHLRSERERQHRINTISAELEKNPPSYDELFFPLPPTYEETLKMYGALNKCSKKSPSTSGNETKTVVLMEKIDPSKNDTKSRNENSTSRPHSEHNRHQVTVTIPELTMA